MCKTNFAFLCCGLFLLITSSSKSQQYSTNNEEKSDNLTVQNEVDMDSTTKYSDEIKSLQYDLYEKLSNNTPQYDMQNKFRIISTNNDHMEVDSILYEASNESAHNLEDDKINSRTNSTNVNHNKNFTSQEVYGNLFEENDFTNNTFEDSSKDSNENKTVPYEMCHNITCILLCCPFGNRMSIEDTSHCIYEGNNYTFPPNVSGYTNDSMQSENKEVNELYKFAVQDSCKKTQHSMVDMGHQYDYTIFANGSIYLSYFKTLLDSKSYCLAIFLERGNKFEAIFCSEALDQVIRNAIKYTPEVRSGLFVLKIFAYLHILCILFLLPVFLVYSILPELRNVHGYMLRHYTAASIIGSTVNIVEIAYYKADITHSACITLAFLEYLFLMSTFFWLSAMSFNMWRTFRAFSSLQRNAKQSEKRTLVYYTTFAYGCPFILGIVCVVILDLLSEYIPIEIRPDFHIGNCWYNGTGPFLLYFYVIKSICIVSSVCLSISSAVKIRHYKKDTNRRLTDSESKRYDNNKKWFNLYMQLFIVMFIVMGINWIVITMSWIFGQIMQDYIIYIVAFLDIAQDFCTFIIFVWKKKIMLMLRKRFREFKEIKLSVTWTTRT